MEFLSSTSSIFLVLLVFIPSLLVIVTVHEYGHYIIGRKSGIEADVFSIGFGPIIWSRYDKRGTKWQLAAVPLGGYVKFRGDQNAASGENTDVMSSLTAEERRKTLHGAPLWARAATVAAGPLFNFAFSVILFAVIVGVRGVDSGENVVGKIPPLPYAVQELQVGDRILAVEGVPVTGSLTEASLSIPVQPVVQYVVDRNGDRLMVDGPYPRPAIVKNVAPWGPAREAGIQVGDVVMSINGVEILSIDQMIEKLKVTRNATVDVEIWRNGETRTIPLTPIRTDVPLPPSADGPAFEERYVIGITGGTFYDPLVRNVGIAESIGIGLDRTWYIITTSLTGIQHMISGTISTCNISGPIQMANTSSVMASEGFIDLLWFVAVLSTAIGLMNLLPIPVLDGGHLCFYAYEAVTRRKPHAPTVKVLMYIGLTIVLSMMALAITNDFICR